MLKEFDGVTNFYGNNTVYITGGASKVQKLERHNFEITAKKDIGDEIWVTSGVVVALGALCTPHQAVEQLKAVLNRMQADLSKGGGDGKCPNGED